MPTVTVSHLLDQLAKYRGNIRCSGEFSVEEINQARDESRLGVMDDGIGFIHTPRQMLNDIRENAPVTKHLQKVHDENNMLRNLIHRIQAELNDPTQGPSETLGKIDIEINERLKHCDELTNQIESSA